MSGVQKTQSFYCDKANQQIITLGTETREYFVFLIDKLIHLNLTD